MKLLKQTAIVQSFKFLILEATDWILILILMNPATETNPNSIHNSKLAPQTPIV
jgi:hypothetical protein